MNISTVLFHRSDLNNFKKLVRHDILADQGIPHTFGTRKNLFGGRSFFLVEKQNEKLTFKNAIPELFRRLMNLIAKIKTFIFQKLHIDKTIEKDPAAVESLTKKIATKITGWGEKDPILAAFGAQVSDAGRHNEEITTELTLAKAEIDRTAKLVEKLQNDLATANTTIAGLKSSPAKDSRPKKVSRDGTLTKLVHKAEDALHIPHGDNKVEEAPAKSKTPRKSEDTQRADSAVLEDATSPRKHRKHRSNSKANLAETVS